MPNRTTAHKYNDRGVLNCGLGGPSEEAILALLRIPFADKKDPDLFRRRQRLAEQFDRVDPSRADRLHHQLEKRQSGDELSELFWKLSTSSRTEMLQILDKKRRIPRGTKRLTGMRPSPDDFVPKLFREFPRKITPDKQKIDPPQERDEERKRKDWFRHVFPGLDQDGDRKRIGRVKDILGEVNNLLRELIRSGVATAQFVPLKRVYESALRQYLARRNDLLSSLSLRAGLLLIAPEIFLGLEELELSLRESQLVLGGRSVAFTIGDLSDYDLISGEMNLRLRSLEQQLNKLNELRKDLEILNKISLLM